MRRIIIVGASSGIGLESARIFARMGWRVGVAARRVENLRALKNQYTDNVEYAEIDITDSSAPDELLKLIERIGGMDILFHVAGTGWCNRSLELEKELVTVETNVDGFVRIIDTAYNYFRDRNRSGQIAAITSVAGTKGLGVSAAYSATKRFQNTYLEALRQLAHIDGIDIQFTDIRPGFVRTPLLDSKRKYPMLMNVDKVSKMVVNAIIKRRKIVYIDFRWRILVCLWRMIPGCLWQRLKIDL